MNIYQMNSNRSKFLNHNNNLIKDLRIYKEMVPNNSKVRNIQNILHNIILKIMKKMNMKMIITKKEKTIK